jgi:hypothetical protein
MRTRLISAAVVTSIFFLIPAVGLAWDASRRAEAISDPPAVGCPVKAETDCPGAAQVELTRLAVAAERGCPVSAAQLIERAKRCPDPVTAELAEKASAGDADAKTELIQRIKDLGPTESGPVDPSTVA